MTDAWVGIDLGTQSLRAVAVSEDGATHGPVTRPFRSTRVGRSHEQDPQQWIAAARSAIEQLVRELPRGLSVRSIAVDGTSGTLVPLTADGAPQGAAVMYDDPRGAPFLEQVQDAGADLWTRMGYRMQPTWALPRLLAMRDTSAARRFGHQPDVVLNHLARTRLGTDLSSALKTGADLDAAGWPLEVLGRLGIDTAELPEVVPSGSALGVVHPAVAAELGLPRGVELIAGTTDGVAAQLAAGAVERGAGCTVLGTTLVLKAVAPTRVGDTGAGVYSHPAPLGDAWFPGGASNVGAGAFSELLPGRDLAALTAAAAALGGVPVSYPLTRPGERFPVPDDTMAGRWPRPTDEMSEAELFRTIAFGVAFVERLAYERLTALGAPVRRVVTTGGGARNGWWLALRSAVLGREVSVPREPEGARGTALLARAGWLREPLAASVAQFVRTSPPVAPLDLADAQVEDAYAAFVDRTDGGTDR
ncbi:FGGY-family carbohydrate kinase [Curtobacterium sp. RRHDQ10]|uniref:FGGY-family carbohydrate kinase n=1 Tax=Curtobacterium phyllosphaerae TaxID=3413379 RepID=UPI003BF150F9